MRLLKYLIAVMSMLICFLNSCVTADNDLKIKISPSDESLIKLSSKIYENSKLSEIANFNGPLSEIDIEYPIECIRKNGEYYRVSYLGAEKVAVLVFDNSGNKISGSVYSIQKSESDFRGLDKGQSLQDVKTIDPHGEYLFLYTGRNDTPKISYHYTRDGYLISIEYDDSNTIINVKKELI